MEYLVISSLFDIGGATNIVDLSWHMCVDFKPDELKGTLSTYDYIFKAYIYM